MKITIKSTPQFTEIDGQRARVWNGTTERGVECKVFVARIAVDPAAEEQFKAELQETGAPRDTAPLVLPLRLVL